MENKDLDIFLQEQVDAGQFPMQEAHWQKALQLIEADETNKKKPFLFWKTLSIIALLLLLGITAFLAPTLWNKNKITATSTTNNIEKINNSENNSENNIANNSVKEIENKTEAENQAQKFVSTTKPFNNAENANAKPSKQKIKTVTTTYATATENEQSNTTPIIATTKVADTAPIIIAEANMQPKTKLNRLKNKAKVSISDIASTNNTNLTTSNRNPELANNKGILKEPTIANISTQTFDAEDAKKEKKNSRKNKTVKKVANQKTNTDINTNDVAVKNIKTENTIEPKTKATPKTKIGKNKKSEKIVLTNTPQNTANTVDATIEEKNIAQINKDRKLKNKPLINSTADGKPLAVTQAIPRDETIYNPRYLPNVKFKSNIKDTTIVRVEKTNETQAIEALPKKPIPNNFCWFIQAGMYANKGFIGNLDTLTKFGFAPYLSTGIKKEFSQRLSVSTQIGLTYYNALNTKKQQNSYRYSFGYDSTFFKVTYNKLLQLYVPLNVHFQFNKSHALQAGLGLTYLLDVQSKTETANLAKQNVLGYSTGFNTTDVFAQIGYSYTINNKFQINLQYTQGFMDATKNAYFNNTLNNKQSRIGVGVTYNLKKLNKN